MIESEENRPGTQSPKEPANERILYLCEWEGGSNYIFEDQLAEFERQLARAGITSYKRTPQ